jgi:hypothetical protein
MAMTPRTATPRTSITSRCLTSRFAQPRKKPRSAWSAAAGFRRAFLGSARTPIMPRNAGTRVIATSTATTMVAAAARPISVRNGMPATARPASAITTVRPAVTTADPAVPTAMATASGTGRPRRNSCRNRVTMNSA